MSIQDQFETSINNDSKVWESYKNKALIMAKSPKTKRISSKYLIEHIRHEKKITIDNRFTSRYARLFCDTFPQHEHLFELRPLLTD